MNQEKILEMNDKFQQSKLIEEQLEFIEQQIVELRSFYEGLESFSKTDEKEFLAPIGKGIFVKSEIKEKELFVDVGQGTFVKKNSEDAKKIIDEQVTKLCEMKYQLNQQLVPLNAEMENFLREFQEKNL